MTGFYPLTKDRYGATPAPHDLVLVPLMAGRDRHRLRRQHSRFGSVDDIEPDGTYRFGIYNSQLGVAWKIVGASVDGMISR